VWDRGLAMHRQEIPVDACHACGYEVSAAATTNAVALKVGDFAVCAACGHLMQYGEGMHLVEVPPAVRRGLRPWQVAELERFRRMRAETIDGQVVVPGKKVLQ
jgi:hypothetical protein